MNWACLPLILGKSVCAFSGEGEEGRGGSIVNSIFGVYGEFVAGF